MIRFCLRLLCLITLLWGAVTLAYAADSAPVRRILYLNSYHQTMNWSKDMLKATYDVLEPDQNNIALYIENLDTKYFYNPAYLDGLASFFKIKYQDLNFDLIMVTDNNAYDFIRHYRDQLFPGIPVTFCSVNDLDMAAVKQLNGFTGVEEIFDTSSTLDIALKLHPNTREVFVVNDYLSSGRAVEREIRRQLTSYQSDLRFYYSDNLSVEELNAQIREMKPGSIVLLGAFYSDSEKMHVSDYQLMSEKLSENASVPIYTLYRFGIHKGVIGGKVASAYQQAANMAVLAQKILAGAAPNLLPVVSSGTTEYVFNFPELKRFGIRESQLPAGSEIINRPFSIYQTYKQQIHVLVVFIVLLLATIAVLLLNIRLRQNAETRLRENELKLKTIFNQSVSFISLLSPDGTLIDTNKPALDFFNLSKDQAIGLPFWDGSWWGEPEVMGRVIKESIDRVARGETLQFEGTVASQSHKHHIFEIILSPVLDDSRQVVYLIAEGRDITERKTAEVEREKLAGQLRQAQKLEAVGTLAGGIAHDFNNILSGILGFNELNLLQLEDRDKVRHNCDHIMAAASRGRELVNQILAFSRKDSEKKVLIEIHRIVEEALSLVRKTAPSSTTITLDIDSNSGWVLSDETQLHQVVMNLATNACHAVNEENGTVHVSLKAVTLLPEDGARGDLLPGDYARLEVADNGKGIPAEVLDKIYDPFFTTKEQGKGTGLGLAVVHGIIQSLHGRIDVESTRDVGTRFTVWIPLSEEWPEGVVSAETGYPRSVRHEHILWVDDESMLAHLGKELLEVLDYRVTAVTSAKEGLRLFSENPGDFDLIVSDQTMPELTGDRLAKAALKIRKEIPIIICTGYSTTLNEAKVREIGIRALLLKPLNLKDLARKVRQLLDDAASES